MDALNLIYWLQGFLEISEAGGKVVTLDANQVQQIKNHIALVLTKVTPEIKPTQPTTQIPLPFMSPQQPIQYPYIVPTQTIPLFDPYNPTIICSTELPTQHIVKCSSDPTFLEQFQIDAGTIEGVTTAEKLDHQQRLEARRTAMKKRADDLFDIKEPGRYC